MLRNRSFPVIVMISLVALAVVSARADVVEMTDGRRFEGEIVAANAEQVRIDTMVTSSIRATLTLKRSEIDRIERKPVPRGFFDPPPPPPRVSPPEDFGPKDTLYIEVPIIGAFGERVFAGGVSRALQYAKRHRVPHVVFVIDSGGGSYDEAEATYKLLKQYDRHLTFHAVVHECRGGALAIPVWCDTIHVAADAMLGGLARSRADDVDPEEEQVMRTQVAAEVSRDLTQKGGEGIVVRAMIDPLEMAAGWRDEDGAMRIGPRPPADLPAERLVFAVDGGELLVLDRDQLVKLGFPPFGGDTATLGAVLEHSGWRKESDFGTQAMSTAYVRKSREKAQTQAQHASAVERNIRRREIAERYLVENLKLAAEWSPNQGSYDEYARRWKWNSGGFYTRSGSWTMTSRWRWRDKTDASLHYLRRAAQGIRTAADLDREAITLGLEPTFATGELAMMAEDLQMKFEFLERYRNRQQ